MGIELILKIILKINYYLFLLNIYKSFNVEEEPLANPSGISTSPIYLLIK